MLARKRAVKEDIPNLAEMLKLMSFYKQVEPEVRTLDLLKYGGFKIKGLQGRNTPDLPKHSLFWNETLNVGICLCGWVGEEGWTYEMTYIQHQIHKRRSDSQVIERVEDATK